MSMDKIINENKKILEYLINNNDKLMDLTYGDSYLYYKDKSVDLSKVNLKLILMSNQYSKFFIDLKENKIDAQTLFDIIKINSVTIEDYNDNKKENLTNYALEFLNSDIKNEENNYDIINSEHYFRIVGNPNSLNNKDLAMLNNYEEYVYLLMGYVNNSGMDNEDYLNNEQRRLVLEYLKKCYAMQNENNKSDVVVKFSDMLAKVNAETSMQKKLELNKEKKAGYINSFLVIGLVIIAGVLIGFCAYYFL